jgi:hypothetical protein
MGDSSRLQASAHSPANEQKAVMVFFVFDGRALVDGSVTQSWFALGESYNLYLIHVVVLLDLCSEHPDSVVVDRSCDSADFRPVLQKPRIDWSRCPQFN